MQDYKLTLLNVFMRSTIISFGLSAPFDIVAAMLCNLLTKTLQNPMLIASFLRKGYRVFSIQNFSNLQEAMQALNLKTRVY